MNEIKRDICINCGRVVIHGQGIYSSTRRFNCWMHDTGKPAVVGDQFCKVKRLDVLTTCRPAKGTVVLSEEQPA